jgi:hypothetical protein
MRGSFLDPLVVIRNDADDSWTVDREFDYYSEFLGITIHVPKGLVTDFASIPRAFWAVLPPAEGRYAKAAVVHDFLYRNRGKFKDPDGSGENVSRLNCDKVLLEAMVVLGTPAWQRFLIYRAVRMFGSLAWNNEPKTEGI